MGKSDKYIDIIINQNAKMTEVITEIREAIHAINDTNKLHCSALERNTTELTRIVAGNKSMMGLFTKIFYTLIVALIALAGVEKLIKLPIW